MRFCSPHFSRVWKPTSPQSVPSLFSCRRLHARPGAPPRSRVDQPDRLHRAKRERARPAPRQLFDGNAHLEKDHLLRRIALLEIVQRRQFRLGQRLPEGQILVFGEWAVQIVRALLRPATAAFGSWLVVRVSWSVVRGPWLVARGRVEAWLVSVGPIAYCRLPIACCRAFPSPRRAEDSSTGRGCRR